MKHRIQSYLHFIWNSKNQHGVHSPFVFDLVTNCFYDKSHYDDYQLIKDYKSSLLENKNKIEVTDFGAGSKVFKSNTRRIDQIAKNAGITTKRAKLLFRIVQYFQPEVVMEIGTSLGIATYAMALGNVNSKIISLEGCRETSMIAQQHFLKSFNLERLKNIDFVVSEFSEYLKVDASHFPAENWNLVYFDGNHTKAATLKYFDALLPTISSKTIWIFDDIHWSPEMEEAWEIIKSHPKVTVTIDTFQWGIVFFRPEQEKEHFTIRV